MKKNAVKFIIIFILIILLFGGFYCFYVNKSNNISVKNDNYDDKKTSVVTKKKKKNENDTSNNEKVEDDKNSLKGIDGEIDTDTQLDTELDNINVDSTYSNYIRLESYKMKLSKSIINKGETSQIDIIYNPEDATYQDASYESSNKKVAIVSRDGVVTGINSGECYIIVNVLNASSGKIKITVVNDNTVVSGNSATDTSNTKSEVNYKENIVSNYNQNSTADSSEIPKEEIDTNEVDTSYNGENDLENEEEKNDEEESELIDVDSTNEDIPTLSDDYLNDSTPTSSTSGTSKSTKSTKAKVKNGWYKIKGKRYYFKDNKKLTNTYVDYIYLNKKGIAQAKMGKFSVTLYGARAWANQNLSIKKTATSSKTVGTVPTGGKMKILSARKSNRYIKIKYKNKIGYVNSDCIYINLPDVIPDITYSITNSSGSIYKSYGYNISGVTGKNLYVFTKQYNSKIGKTTYYAPMLFPVARQLQTAYDKAKSQGYGLKIYDTYRPYHVSMNINNKFKNLYNSNSKVKKHVDYDKNGKYWGPSWFLAQKASRHNSGTAVDLCLTNSKGVELSGQTKMHTLDTRSLTKYNNKNANKLKSIMTSAGFETLKSEWWHFQENSYASSNITSFNVR